MDQVKLGTLNLCLGLKNKKDLVRQLLIENKIDILCMQELEIEADFDCNLLRIPGYELDCEVNNHKRRVGCYIKNNLKYKWRLDLEGENNHLVIFDLMRGSKRMKRIINVYRSFNPHQDTAMNFFVKQLNLIKIAFSSDTILVGDFNLDYNKKFDVNYCNANLFVKFEEHLGDLNLLQI